MKLPEFLQRALFAVAALVLLPMAGAGANPVQSQVSSLPVQSVVAAVAPQVLPVTPKPVYLEAVSLATVKPTTSNYYNTTPYVQLTFDDTASTTNLQAILSILKKNNVKATFFFNTKVTSLAKYKTIRAARMDVGNHTFDHALLTRLSYSQIRSEWVRGKTKYANTNLMRPPYGATSTTVRRAIADLHGRQCLWTVDTMDWSKRYTLSANDIVRRVRYGDHWTRPVYAGGVVLMHGTGRYTVAALQGVIDAVKARGLKLQPLH